MMNTLRLTLLSALIVSSTTALAEDTATTTDNATSAEATTLYDQEKKAAMAEWGANCMLGSPLEDATTDDEKAAAMEMLDEAKETINEEIEYHLERNNVSSEAFSACADVILSSSCETIDQPEPPAGCEWLD